MSGSGPASGPAPAAAQAVISDFGGVLTSPLAEAFAALTTQAGIPADALGRALGDIAEREGAHPLHQLETGQLSEERFMARLGRSLSAALGREVAMTDFGERYFAALRPNEALIDYMRSLRQRGLRLALLTNNVREWESRWRAMLPVQEIFEVVVDSARVGIRKPNPEIYAITLDRLGLPAQACVFLDDVEVNCQAARELGIATVRFHSNEQAMSDVEAALRGLGAG